MGDGRAEQGLLHGADHDEEPGHVLGAEIIGGKPEVAQGEGARNVVGFPGTVFGANRPPGSSMAAAPPSHGSCRNARVTSMKGPSPLMIWFRVGHAAAAGCRSSEDSQGECPSGGRRSP